MDNKKNIPVYVKNRVAWSDWAGFIVCGNGDYSITFTFDEEWGEDTAKTAIFKYRTDEGMEHTKQPFIGNTVAVPELRNIREVEVGVRFGDIATTTGATIRCVPSVLCDSGEQSEYEKERFDELMQLFNDTLHRHENLKTLADFYCLASELQNDNGPTILPDVVGVDRVSFRGNYLRYCSDGGVVKSVEEIEREGTKFLRLRFDMGPLVTNFNVPEFIDLPVSGFITANLYEDAKGHVSRFEHQYFKNTALDTNKVDIAIFAGQSNSCGRATLEDVTTVNDIIVPVSVDKGFSFNNTESTIPLQIVEPITANGSTGYGYIPSFINAYNKATGRRICACYKSFGGAMLNKWSPYVLDDTTGEETATVGAFYKVMVDAVSHAKTNLIASGYEVGDVFLVWCQGEADAAYLGNANVYANAYEQSLSTDEEIKAYYKARFLRLVEKLKEDTGLSTAFIIRVGHSQMDLARNAKIIEAQNELCRENASCVMVSSIFAGATRFIEEDGTTRNLMRDASHYVPEGYLRAGLEAGVNAGIYNNSNKLVKPLLLEYNNLINVDTNEHERAVDAWLYDPERIDLAFIKAIAANPVVPPDEPAVDENVVFDFDFTANTINDYALDGLFTIPDGSTPDAIEYDATKGMTLNEELPNGLNLATPIDATKPWTIEFTATIAEPSALDGNRKALIAGNSGAPFVYIGARTAEVYKFGYVYGCSAGNDSCKKVFTYNEEHTYKIVYDGIGSIKTYCDDILKTTNENTFTGEFGVIFGNAVGQSTAWVWRNVESTNTYLKKFKFKYDGVTTS
ncbi:MAG: hypothetical protein J6B99_09755 [Oscillospiraceae bacterium]|nr:hypothetical protein [Oscillospiraceae bacterium]